MPFGMTLLTRTSLASAFPTLRIRTTILTVSPTVAFATFDDVSISKAASDDLAIGSAVVSDRSAAAIGSAIVVRPSVKDGAVAEADSAVVSVRLVSPVSWAEAASISILVVAQVTRASFAVAFATIVRTSGTSSSPAVACTRKVSDSPGARSPILKSRTFPLFPSMRSAFSAFFFPAVVLADAGEGLSAAFPSLPDSSTSVLSS